MKKLVFILTSIIVSVSSAQELKNKIALSTNAPKKVKETLSHPSIQLETDQIFNKLVQIRRDLHENPELAGNEIRTQKVITQYLLDLGLEVEKDSYGHGVVGILKGGKPGKKIAWRADMDALPTDFPEDLSFKSKNKGIQHGCGHDIHMTIGLGIAEVLSKNKASLKGTVYFIFQPEEETFIGAKGIINDGLLTKINPNEIYGLHVSALPVGQIMVKPNEMFAYQKRVRIKLKNELSKEESKVLTKKIHSFLSRTITTNKPWELQYMSDPKFGLINPNTIFKDYLFIDENFNSAIKNEQLVLDAYVYETDSAKLKEILPKLRQVIESSGYKDQLLSLSFTQENPTVINNEKLTQTAIKTLQNIYGKEAIVADYGQVPFFNDDFSYFQQKVPGVYFFLGGSNFEKGIIAMNHMPNFKVDEESIRVGVKSFSSLIFERLNDRSK